MGKLEEDIAKKQAENREQKSQFDKALNEMDLEIHEVERETRNKLKIDETDDDVERLHFEIAMLAKRTDRANVEEQQQLLNSQLTKLLEQNQMNKQTLAAKTKRLEENR